MQFSISSVKWQQLPNELFAGLMSATMMLLIAVSLSTLICGSHLSAYLAQFIATALVSSIIAAVVYAFASSFPNIGIASQDTPALLTALIAAALYGQSYTSQTQYFSTVYIAMLLISFVGGVFLLILGRLKLGNSVRFIPYPVIGGFLAGMGWLIFLGIWPVLLGKSLTWQSLSSLGEFQSLVHWVPALGVGFCLLFFQRRYQHPLVVPLLTLFFLSLFFLIYGLLKMKGVSLENLHLFLGPFPKTEPIWPWFQWTALSQTNWSLILKSSGSILLICVLAPIAILVNSASFEVLSQQEVDFDRELKVGGISGVLGPFLGGGAFAYTSVVVSFLNHTLGSRHRIINILAAMLCFGVLWMGSSFLNSIPRFLAPAILFFIAFEFMIDWLYKPWFNLSKKDYAIIMIIFITIISSQLLYGIILGLVISLVKFAWEYSRIDPIDGLYYGQTLSSHVLRNQQESRVLELEGLSVCLVRLHGYLFFGNAYRAFKKVEEVTLSSEKNSKIQYLIFDFSAVDGVDSSCRSVISNFLRKAKFKNIQILTVGLFHREVLDAEKELQGSGFEEKMAYAEVNEALEWCEQQLLELSFGHDYISAEDISELKKDLTLSQEDYDHLRSYWQGPRVLNVNEVLIQQDDQDRDIYFLSRGSLSVVLEGQDSRVILTHVHAGSILGELAYYTGETRSTSIVALTACEVYGLSFENFNRLEQDYPKIALRLHHYIVEQLTESIKYSNQIVHSLLHHR